MTRLISVVLSLFLGLGATHAQTDEDPKYDADLYREGSVLPLDTIVLQVAEDERVGFLKGAIIVGADGTATYRLRDILSSEPLIELPLVLDARGNVSVSPDATGAVTDDLAAVVFKAGCGRWWKGRRNYWQVCTGRDSCGGDDGRRWCTKLVSRDRCESEGNCPTNSSVADDVLTRDDLPIAFLPPSDELRYCCKLTCTNPLNPSSCTNTCTEVPVGPCAVFTVNCPGTIGHGGCTWD